MVQKPRKVCALVKECGDTEYQVVYMFRINQARQAAAHYSARVQDICAFVAASRDKRETWRSPAKPEGMHPDIYHRKIISLSADPGK